MIKFVWMASFGNTIPVLSKAKTMPLVAGWIKPLIWRYCAGSSREYWVRLEGFKTQWDSQDCHAHTAQLWWPYTKAWVNNEESTYSGLQHQSHQAHIESFSPTHVYVIIVWWIFFHVCSKRLKKIYNGQKLLQWYARKPMIWGEHYYYIPSGHDETTADSSSYPTVDMGGGKLLGKAFLT